jgi:hypothetical membrane protein
MESMLPRENGATDRAHPAPTRLTLLGGSLYIVAVAQYFIAQFYVAQAWSPPYDWFNDYISDLGNTACAMFSVPHGAPAYVCSPRHASMNAAFVASGVLLMAGTTALWKFWPGGTAIRGALTLLMIAGCGKILVGCAPENENIVLHAIAAFNIPVASLAALVISVVTFRKQRTLALIGFGAFVLGAVGTMLSIAAQVAGPALLLGLGPGGMERLAGYPANLWLVAVGLAAMDVRPDWLQGQAGRRT